MTTSVKAKFRPSRVKGKTGSIYFQVIHNRVARQIGTGYKLFPKEWKDGKVVLPKQNSERNRYLTGVALNLQRIKKRLETIIGRFDDAGNPYTTNEVVAAYKLPDDDEHSLRVFSHKLAEHLKRTNMHRLAETYISSVNSFLRFCGKQGDILLDEINDDLIKEYEHYLLEDCGLCRNTSSFYNRNLRAIYNRAVKKKLTIDRHPFAEVYTGVDKTSKRAIPIKTVKEIKDLDLSKDAEMAFARDLYMMCFNLRGISFVDLAMLKTDQLKNGYLTYSRQKTRQKLEIKWEKQMQEIVDRHHIKGSRYLLPILSEEGGDTRRQYLNALHRVNARLKKIGKIVGCYIPLTTYTARHGWADAAIAAYEVGCKVLGLVIYDCQRLVGNFYQLVCNFGYFGHIAVEPCFVVNQHQHRLAVGALFEFVHTFHRVGISGIATYSPNGVGGIEYDSAAAHHFHAFFMSSSKMFSIINYCGLRC